MRIFGWICIVFGGLALIGAIVGGNSAFGPLFWLGLGIALLYFAGKKSNKNEENNNQ